MLFAVLIFWLGTYEVAVIRVVVDVNRDVVSCYSWCGWCFYIPSHETLFRLLKENHDFPKCLSSKAEKLRISVKRL